VTGYSNNWLGNTTKYPSRYQILWQIPVQKMYHYNAMFHCSELLSYRVGFDSRTDLELSLSPTLLCPEWLWSTHSPVQWILRFVSLRVKRSERKLDDSLPLAAAVYSGLRPIPTIITHL
jgi:hypothetical protein